MVSREDKIKAVIDSNKPFYKQHDLKPRDGGRSRLHDANGTPKFRPFKQSPQEDVRETGDRVAIQGSKPAEQPIAKPLNKRELNPRRSAAEPVRQNIGGDLPVHVGSHEEHAWYDDNVVGGGSRTTSARQYIDNNYIDTEGLQGADPLAEPVEENFEEFHQNSRTHVAVGAPNPLEDGFRATHEEVGETPSQEQENSIASNTYSIFVDNEFVIGVASKSEALRCIEDIMLNYKVSLDRISAFKKLELNFGVNLND